MANSLSLISPAKINLFLKIINRRSDGYHNLASLFQAISLTDHLTVAPAPTDAFTCSDPSLPCDRSNLVWKAVELYRSKTGNHFPVKIHLEKNIPHQAGLGGGSGNAATALWAMNALSGNPLPVALLGEWSAEIGSDIPFFFSSGTAYCTGRGEVVQSVALPKSDEAIWIVKPKEGLLTPAVYRQVEIEKFPKMDVAQALQEAIEGRGIYFNDLEEAAFKVEPSLAILKKNLLQSGFKTVLMSGSGSAFFCLGKPKKVLLEKVFEGLFYQEVSYLNREGEQWYSHEIGS